ncbi:small integral membrane protein 34A [Ornithorhynchus anatinus]|uniref:small integral membrane protein 34A n=1 Tax=Ornithorhynchus anatinus TaxID=9258 RepID=UPI0019D4D565|nr:small integral membrane protein 34A [Ornithorhynchus anatinus]
MEPPRARTGSPLEKLLDNGTARTAQPDAPRDGGFPDGASVSWYVLTIMGVYGVIVVFLLASSILRQGERLPNASAGLPRKGAAGGAPDGPWPTVSVRAGLGPDSSSPDPRRESADAAGKEGIEGAGGSGPGRTGVPESTGTAR